MIDGQARAFLLTPAQLCPADIDDDGTVGVTDFLLLLSQWGPCPGCTADLDGDGVVGILDFLALLAAWRPCFAVLDDPCQSSRGRMVTIIRRDHERQRRTLQDNLARR